MLKKKCKKCGKLKLLNRFPKKRSLKFGKHIDDTMQICKQCRYGIDWEVATPKQCHERIAFLFNNHVIKKDNDCWDWSGDKNKWGYGCMQINGIKHNAHRISWMVHKEIIKPGQYVLHKCDNRICTNPEHLFLGTAKDNMHDMANKGRKITHRGSDCSYSKLTDEQVANIIHDLEDGMRDYILARKYNISRSVIYDLKTKRKWKHLDIVKNHNIKIKKHFKRVLTEELVKEIKQLFRDGKKISEISKIYEINYITISDIKHGRTWKKISVN